MAGEVDQSLDSVLVARRVLVDTGAHEVIRPYKHDWWNDVMVKREKGRPVTLELSGRVTAQGAMT
eukprot:8749421-Prorocentrum_lima.AAC.1